MTDDNKIIEEQWASDAWEACVKGQSGDNEVSDEQLVKDVLDAEKDLQRHDVPLPPPTLVSLASGLAAQAMVSLGVFPNPVTGKCVMLLHQAAHLIDTVQLLFEKTAGNRTDEETKTLENALHELRMIYLAAQKEKAGRSTKT